MERSARTISRRADRGFLRTRRGRSARASMSDSCSSRRRRRRSKPSSTAAGLRATTATSSSTPTTRRSRRSSARRRSSSASKPPQEFFDAALAANAQMQEFCRTQLGAIGRALAAHARPSAAPDPPRVRPGGLAPRRSDAVVLLRRGAPGRGRCPSRTSTRSARGARPGGAAAAREGQGGAAVEARGAAESEEGCRRAPHPCCEQEAARYATGGAPARAARPRVRARDQGASSRILARLGTAFGKDGYKLGDGDAKGAEIRDWLIRLLDDAGDYESGVSAVPWSDVAEMMPGGARSAVECSVQWRQVDDPRIRPFLHKMGLQKQEPRVDVPFGDAEAAELRRRVEEGGLTHGRVEERERRLAAGGAGPGASRLQGPDADGLHPSVQVPRPPRRRRRRQRR